MILGLALIAGAVMLLFILWLANDKAEAPRAKHINPFYCHGRQGSTDWDTIHENERIEAL